MHNKLLLLLLLHLSVPFQLLAQAPSVSTNAASTIVTNSPTSISIGGNVSNAGGSAVIARGVVYSKSGSPTLGATGTISTTNGTGTGVFTATLTALDSGFTYYLKAYATNSSGTAYGSQISFHTSAPINLLVRHIIGLTPNTAFVVHDANSQQNAPQNTARGYLLATHNNPGFSDTVRTLNAGDLGNGRGDRVHAISGLLPGTRYVVRAYATNYVGTSVSDTFSFTTPTAGPTSVGCPSPTDVDGNTYPVIKIGSQCWLQSNLKTTRYRNGDSVRYITDNTQWASTAGTSTARDSIGAWCYYQNDSTNNLLRGKLYNWYALTDARGLCPVGWSAPTSSDFDNVLSSVRAGGGVSNFAAIGLKSANYGYVSNNSSGFSAVPGFRRRDYDGIFEGANDPAHFWTKDASCCNSVTNFNSNATQREFAIHRNDVQNVNKNKRHGYSVRCVRNATLTLTTLPATLLGATGFSTGGSVGSQASDSIYARGVAYATHPNPTLSNSYVQSGTGSGSFQTSVTGLNAGSTYYFRAYAVVESGTAYGEVDSISLVPSQVLATLTTTPISNLSDTSAQSGGDISSDGGATVTLRGVAYGTSPAPDLNASTTSDGDSVGAFTSSITGLNRATTYYLRAYATNSVGTAYGQELTFTTLARVSGSLRYDNASTTSLTNSTVSLTRTGQPALNASTGSGNALLFSPMETGAYHVVVSTQKPWGGVNATDAILMINHYSNGAPLQGLRLTAADVDLNSAVNATDALQTLQRSVGIRTSFDAGNFVWSPASLNIPLGSGPISLPVTALATGDVNASYVPSLQLRPHWLDFSATETHDGSVPSENGTLPLSVNLPVVPAAVSLSLALPAGARLLGVDVPQHQSPFPVLFHQDGQMARIAWCDPTAALKNAGSVLCNLRISGGEPSQIRWGSESEIANPQGEAYDGLIWRMPYTSPSVPRFDIRLFPNPASGQRTIAWSLSHAAELDFQIYNMLGTLVWQNSQAATAGSQRIELPADWSADWSAGIYTVRAKAVLADGQVILHSIKMIEEK